MNTFELTLQKLVFGGAALGYHDGRAAFVPLALPGERVEVEAVRTLKGLVHARLLKVLEPAPERIVPLCPYFGCCGGCHYQHMQADRALEWKASILRETLRRVGKIDWEREIPVHEAYAWHYRNHAQLKVELTAQGGVALGFYAAESHRLMEIESCCILSPCLNRTLAQLREVLQPAWLKGCREIAMLADEGDRRVMLHFRGRLEAEATEKIAAAIFPALPAVTALALDLRDRTERRGEPQFFYQVGDFRYQVSPGSFFQASRFLLPGLVAAVTAFDKGPGNNDPQRGLRRNLPSTALDLYAGCGLFSLPLARHYDAVIAVESDPASASDLAARARAHGLLNLQTIHQRVGDFLRRFAGPPPELVVLDPPRAGVDARSLRLLLEIGSAQLRYVSCHPPTLARDLRFLIQHGYQLDSIELFDLFPQTFHIESVARLLYTPERPA